MKPSNSAAAAAALKQASSFPQDQHESLAEMARAHREYLASLPPKQEPQPKVDLATKRVDELTSAELEIALAATHLREKAGAASRPVGELDSKALEVRLEEARKKEKAAADAANAAAKHTTFEDERSKAVRAQLRQVRKALDGAICLPEGFADEIERLHKTIEVPKETTRVEGWFSRKLITEVEIEKHKVPLADEDAAPFTKEELLAYVSMQNARNAAVITSVIDLVHLLKLDDEAAEVALVQQKLKDFTEDRDAKRQKKVETSKRGCECGGGACAAPGQKGGQSCKCHNVAACSSKCSCKGGPTCENPLTLAVLLKARRANNVREDVDMTAAAAAPKRG